MILTNGIMHDAASRIRTTVLTATNTFLLLEVLIFITHLLKQPVVEEADGNVIGYGNQHTGYQRLKHAYRRCGAVLGVFKPQAVHHRI